MGEPGEASGGSRGQKRLAVGGGCGAAQVEFRIVGSDELGDGAAAAAGAGWRMRGLAWPWRMRGVTAGWRFRGLATA